MQNLPIMKRARSWLQARDHQRMWLIGGVGCALMLAYTLYVMMSVVVAGFFAVRAAGNFFITPTRNSAAFLEAIADDNLRRALRFVDPSAATDVETLREMLPEGMSSIASVGEKTYSRFAGNGDGNITYRVMMEDGTTAQVGMSMDIHRSEWLVKSIGLYDDE